MTRQNRERCGIAVLLFFFSLPWMGCTSPTSEYVVYQIYGQTMGTTYSVKVVLPREASMDTEALGKQVFSALDRVDHLMSNYKENSELSRLNRSCSHEPLALSPETAVVFQRALEIHELTQGAFDPTLGPLIDLWGFGAPERNAFPENQHIEVALALVGVDKLILDGNQVEKTVDGLTVNLSAIAKGFGVDQVFRVLDGLGFQDFMVEVGGEVRTQGLNGHRQPWQIGIEAPSPGNVRRDLVRTVSLSGMALATSGDYRNHFTYEGRLYSHIIDPRDGRPVERRVASASVIARDCMTADALATAFMIMSPEESVALVESLPDTECLILCHTDHDDTWPTHASSGMSNHLNNPQRTHH